jgi:signal peptidase
MHEHLRPRRLIGTLFTLAMLGAWFVFLAPTTIGGPTAYIEVSGHSMDGTYETGDLVITREQDSYEVGDIVTFAVGGSQVIHRIIGGDGRTGYTLQGDNNPDPDPWHPTDAEVVGESWIRIPGKAWMLRLPTKPLFAGSASGLVALLYLLNDERRSRRTAGRDAGEGADRGQPVVGRKLAMRLAAMIGLPAALFLVPPVATNHVGSAATLDVTAAPVQSEDHVVEPPVQQPDADETGSAGSTGLSSP